MEVNDPKILLIDVTFYHYRVLKMIFNMLIKHVKKQILSGPEFKGLLM